MSVLLNRRRPVPADFAEQVSVLGDRNALARHYRTGSDVVERWFAETGMPIPLAYTQRSAPTCSQCGKKMKHRSATGLCREHWRAVYHPRREVQETPARRKVFVNHIIAHAAAVFGVTEAEILGGARVSRVCRPRFAVCYLAREMTDLSLPHIGLLIGGRDHSTIVHAARQCAEHMRSWPGYARNVAIIRWLAEGGERFAPPPPPEPEPTPEPEPVAVTDSPEWWHLSDDELIAQRIAAHRAKGGDFVEVRA